MGETPMIRQGKAGESVARTKQKRRLKMSRLLGVNTAVRRSGKAIPARLANRAACLF
jgi:hypothetical protein